MAFVDYANEAIQCTVVYWGPQGSGKTANLMRSRSCDTLKAVSKGVLTELHRGA